MLLIKPFLGCNLACKYCYERDLRKKDSPKMTYNLKAILNRMEEFKDLEMSLHGGEALTLPKKDVAKILEKMHELKGKSSVQTNGTLIDDEYIEIFKKYKTSVGISFDGPGELSEFRPGSMNIDKIIEKLVKEKLGVSIIIVLSKANADTKDRLAKLKQYLLELEKMKICGRINPCMGAPGYDLDTEKMKEAYLDLAAFCLEKHLKWSPFVDVMHGLQGKSRVCTLMGCDSFHTMSATVILDDGSITNCMRTNQDEILLRHPAFYNTRKELLADIAQEFGGCKGCRYWTACYGGCPTSAINDDWRNRTSLCPIWKALFQYFEKILNFTEYPNILNSASKKECVSQGEKNQTGFKHLDHSDQAQSQEKREHADGHGDSHGDSPHGDWENHADNK